MFLLLQSISLVSSAQMKKLARKSMTEQANGNDDGRRSGKKRTKDDDDDIDNDSDSKEL